MGCSKKYKRTVKAVKKSRSAVNPYAVAHSAIKKSKAKRKGGKMRKR